MPDRDAKTIKDQIYYQHAKVIARSAFTAGDGVEVERRSLLRRKNDLPGAVKRRKALVRNELPRGKPRDIKDGTTTYNHLEASFGVWTRGASTREDWQFVEADSLVGIPDTYYAEEDNV